MLVNLLNACKQTVFLVCKIDSPHLIKYLYVSQWVKSILQTRKNSLFTFIQLYMHIQLLHALPVHIFYKVKPFMINNTNVSAILKINFVHLSVFKNYDFTKESSFHIWRHFHHTICDNKVLYRQISPKLYNKLCVSNIRSE